MKIYQLLAMLMLLFLGGSILNAQAQTSPMPDNQEPQAQKSMAELTDEAKADLQSFFLQYLQSQAPFSALAFYEFAHLSRSPSNAYSDTHYNAFSHKLYQPVYVLPRGAWIMGVEDKGSGLLGVWVDVNNAEPPGYRGDSEAFDQKEFILNTSGQIVQVIH